MHHLLSVDAEVLQTDILINGFLLHPPLRGVFAPWYPPELELEHRNNRYVHDEAYFGRSKI